MIRLLIADEQTLMRAGLRLILDAQPDIEVVAEASDPVEAQEAVRLLEPDVVVLDAAMLDRRGLEALQPAGPAPRAVRVLVLAALAHDEHLDTALAAGASGFILKSASPDELLAAVRAVAAGHAFLTPAVTRRVLDAFARKRRRVVRQPEALARLTERELQVLRLVARGLSNREVAAVLEIAETTIRTHVAHLFKKLSLRDRAQAVALAHESGVLDAD
jgi:DNA-binding NarL/FixJ family response regulator